MWCNHKANFEIMEEVEKERSIQVANPNSSSITNVSPTVNNLNLLNPEERAKLELYLKSIMGSEKCGIKSMADGLAIFSRAQDLGLPFTSSIEHIGAINGKTVIDVHLIKALLLKAAITWDCTKDYVALYEYTDGNNVYVDGKIPDYCKRFTNRKDALEYTVKEDGNSIGIYPVRYYQDYKGNVYKEYQMNGSFGVSVNMETAAQIQKEGKTPVFRVANVPVDYIVEYKFTRRLDNRIMESVSHFSYSDAVTAGLLSKDTYAKYTRILIGHRAFTYGARDIGSDVLLGCQEMTEAKIMNNIPLEEADVIPI